MRKEVNLGNIREYKRFYRGEIFVEFWKISKSWKVKMNNGDKDILNEIVKCESRKYIGCV